MNSVLFIYRRRRSVHRRDALLHIARRTRRLRSHSDVFSTHIANRQHKTTVDHMRIAFPDSDLGRTDESETSRRRTRSRDLHLRHQHDEVAADFGAGIQSEW